MSVIARIDTENNADEFWSEFHREMSQLDQGSELYANCRQLLKSDYVEIFDPDAIMEFDSFVNSISGFANGPEHAAKAIVFQAN